MRHFANGAEQQSLTTGAPRSGQHPLLLLGSHGSAFETNLKTSMTAAETEIEPALTSSVLLSSTLGIVFSPRDIFERLSFSLRSNDRVSKKLSGNGIFFDGVIPATVI